MSLIEHPSYPPRRGRWCVFVTFEGVRGCTGSYRWQWRARLRAHSNQRYWPGTKQVEIEWVPRPVAKPVRVSGHVPGEGKAAKYPPPPSRQRSSRGER